MMATLLTFSSIPAPIDRSKPASIASLTSKPRWASHLVAYLEKAYNNAGYSTSNRRTEPYLEIILAGLPIIVCVCTVGTGGPIPIDTCNIGTIKVSTAQIGITKVSTSQVGTSQVGTI